MTPPEFVDLTVCGIDELESHRDRGVSHVLSILDPGQRDLDTFSSYQPHVRMTLYFHDAIERRPGVFLPRPEDVEEILAFGRDVGPDLTHLLIHCHAGISRSTAAMTMILAQRYPEESEEQIVARLATIRPQAWPNSRMIGFADEQLGRQGRLMREVTRIYARRLAAKPELAEVMRGLDRVREVEMGRRASP